MLVPIALEVVARCRACGEVVAVNAVTDHATCEHCQRAFAPTLESWAQLLADPVAHAATLAMNDEIDGAVERPEAAYRRVFRRNPLFCAGCAVPLPDAAVASGLASGVVACPGCATRVGVRAIAGVGPAGTLFVGEHVDDATAAAAPRPWLCDRCGAPLRRAGHEPTADCRYCHTQHAFPADHGEAARGRPVRRFFMLVPCAGDATAVRPFAFGAVRDVVCDAAGNFVIVGTAADGTGGGEDALFSLDAAFRLRWIHRGVRSNRVWRAGDGVMVASADGPAWYGADTGERRALGDALAAGLRGCEHASVAPEGTSVVALRFGRVVRVGLDGRDAPLFVRDAPAEIELEPTGFLGGLFGRKHAVEPDADVPESVTPRTALGLCALPGGGFVLLGMFDAQSGFEAREYGRSGALRWSVALAPGVIGFDQWIAPSPLGGVFFESSDRLLWIRAGGDSVIVDTSAGGRLRGGGAPRLATAPDGTMYVFHGAFRGAGCVRTLARDGTVRVSNEAALRADRET